MQDDSMALVEVMAPLEKTLDELAQIANREYDNSVSALEKSIFHAINCGEALIQCRSRMTAPEWQPWVDSNLSISPVRASNFMRLAAYREHIPLDALGPYRDKSGNLRYPTSNTVLGYVKGLPHLFHDNRLKGEIPQAVKGEAKKLRKKGMKYQQIADMLGISRAAVMRICDPEYAARCRAGERAWARKKTQAAKALIIQEQRTRVAAAATHAGGAISETYSLIRRAAQKADLALAEMDDKESRAAVALALSRIHAAEDAIGAALKIPPPRFRESKARR